MAKPPPCLLDAGAALVRLREAFEGLPDAADKIVPGWTLPVLATILEP